MQQTLVTYECIIEKGGILKSLARELWKTEFQLKRYGLLKF
jgi:hypothetical protein